MHYEDKVKIDSSAFLYAKMLADEVGKEKALGMLDTWATGFASMGIAQKKRQLGVTGQTLKDWYNLMRAFDEQFGMWLEIEEETPDMIEHRYLNCTMPATCAASGWDCKEICERIIYPLCDKVTPILSPKIKWEVIEFNPDIAVGCKYRITYRDKS